MEVKQMKIDEIKPYERNPRKNDQAVKYVAESIKQFGFKVPIVIDANGVIVAGHTRYKAAKELMLDEVPCVVASDLTDEQVKAFRLADNKVSEKSHWDLELLDLELEDLFDFDMEVFGFEGVEEIDWDNVDELDEESYEEPQKKLLKCPNCNHVDSAERFMKVSE